MSDDALWIIAREQMPEDVQERPQVLLSKNALETIRDKEYQELKGYVVCGDHL